MDCFILKSIEIPYFNRNHQSLSKYKIVYLQNQNYMNSGENVTKYPILTIKKTEIVF